MTAPDGRSLTPAEWLLDVLYRPKVADTYQTFEIVHPEVLALFSLTNADGAGGKRFSAQQLAGKLNELERQAKLASDVESAIRTPFQRAVVQRELMPQDLKIEVDRLTQADATTLAGYLAGVVGRAHGRQMDAATRDGWLSELGKARAGALDAPSWLWASVVDLLSIHEAAYLDHCRRFVLSSAACSRLE